MGIDIGGTKCAVLLGRAQGDADDIIIDKLRFETRVGRGWCAVTEELLDNVEEIIKKNALSPEDILCAGISCGGPLDSRRGVILAPPNLPDWECVPIVDMIEERFGFDAYLQNDANACALAEWKFGAGKGLRNMIFLTFGTGMGAGLILDGKLYSGTNDMAGEVGHMRIAADGPIGYGKRGSFEGFCSGGGIGRLAQEMARKTLENGGSTLMCKTAEDIENITAKSAAEAAENGDETAKEVYRICGEKLGEGLAILADILDPQAIIIGSIFARSGHLLKDSMEKALHREALSQTAGCRIIPAGLGEKIGDLASLGIALDAAGKRRKSMNREKEIFEELFVRYPALEGIREDIKSAYDVICACFDRGGKLLICGNGGSAADAQHIVGELMKGFLLKRELTDEQRQAFLEIKDGEYLANHLQGALPAVALSAHEGLNTAFANDIAADMIFAQQVWAYASSSPDALIALSTSGNSANVVNAVKVANAMGIESIGITGEKMSLMSEMCTVCLRLPETETFKVQELTLPIYHALCAMAEATYFNK